MFLPACIIARPFLVQQLSSSTMLGIKACLLFYRILQQQLVANVWLLLFRPRRHSC
jgi:hypothetical protein